MKTLNIIATFCLFSLSLLSDLPSLHGQSYLEKLEESVKKQQPKEKDAESPTVKESPGNPLEELPAPEKSASEKSDQSILKLPTPSEDETVAPELSPGVFLGLDAESLDDGRIGVVIGNVAADSPAWKAGFKPGDRILGVDGFAIRNLDTFAERVMKLQPGKPSKFLIDRRGRNVQLVVVPQNFDLAAKIGTANDSPIVAPPPAEPASSLAGSRPWLGCSVADLSEPFRRQFSIPAFRGAAVSNVVSGSPADRAGIKPGDVIVELQGRAIESAADLMEWLSMTRPGDVASVVYFRGLNPKQEEIVIGAIAGSEVENSIPDLESTNNDPNLPIATQLEILETELRASQQRVAELQREIEALRRQLVFPRGR